MRVQEIAKVLNKAGLRKATTKRVNFETVNVGDYEARLLNYNGINCTILPLNGMTTETIINILTKENINCYEKRGYVAITK